MLFRSTKQRKSILGSKFFGVFGIWCFIGVLGVLAGVLGVLVGVLAYLIFVAGTTGGARVKKFCPV